MCEGMTSPGCGEGDAFSFASERQKTGVVPGFADLVLRRGGASHIITSV